ncbi:MAG: hypothetical protein HYX95_01820 [Chloroflexi bacterium]|nr:hypothetical protein [Chloroflexota bacterium]
MFEIIQNFVLAAMPPNPASPLLALVLVMVAFPALTAVLVLAGRSEGRAGG